MNTYDMKHGRRYAYRSTAMRKRERERKKRKEQGEKCRRIKYGRR